MRCFLIVVATIFSNILFASYTYKSYDPSLLKIGLNNKIYDDSKELASVLQESKTKAKKIVFVGLDEAVVASLHRGFTFFRQDDSVRFNNGLVKKLRKILKKDMAYIVFVTNIEREPAEIFEFLEMKFPDNFGKIPVVFFDYNYFYSLERYKYCIPLGLSKIDHMLLALRIFYPLMGGIDVVSPLMYSGIDVVLIDDDKRLLEEFKKTFIGRTMDRNLTIERVLAYYPGTPKKVRRFSSAETIVWKGGKSFKKVKKFLKKVSK